MIDLRRFLALALLLGASGAAWADVVVPTRPIRSNAVLTREDLTVIPAEIAGALTSVDQAVGLEARTTLYPGRPVHPGDLGPAAVVDRNQIVTMIYEHAGLVISAEGRVLDRAGPGERVRVMNIDSRSIVIGQVEPSGRIKVSK